MATKHADVFVLTQFGGEFDEIYKNIIKPLVKAFGLTVSRADEKPGPYVITESIKESISNCRFAIANITASNANVFYEIGYAHALNKEVILLFKKSSEVVPFDVRGIMHIGYETDIAGVEKFKKELKRHIKAVKTKTEKSELPASENENSRPSDIQHVSIAVNNWEEARDFYRDVVGLTEMDRPRSYPFYGAWFALENGQHLHIVQKHKEEGDKGTIVLKNGKTVPTVSPFPNHFAFSVKDFEGACERLSKHVEIIDSGFPHAGIYQIYFEDGFGNLVEINKGLKTAK